ncbi:MAG: hypothetical protein R3174_13040, partial [Gammaproteobacteria bacterium]|nr:hypothetical protein [Gammaproteobacteria bacterium]
RLRRNGRRSVIAAPRAVFRRVRHDVPFAPGRRNSLRLFRPTGLAHADDVPEDCAYDGMVVEV